MSRMYDRLLGKSSHWLASEFPYWQASPAAVDATIVADNVGEYRAFHETDQPDTWLEFPGVMPPLKHFFVETRRPEKYPDWYPLAWGVEFQVADAQTGVPLPLLSEKGEKIGMYASQSKWILKAFLFTEYRKGNIHLSLSGCGSVRADGTLVKNWQWFNYPHPDQDERLAIKASTVKPYSSDGDAAVQQELAYYHLLLCIPFMAIAFMNCKNVVLVDSPPAPKLSRAHQKRHGVPLITYKTLRVKPVTLSHYLKEAESVDKAVGGQALPLHITRGHFKDYRDGKGLFGKYQGLFWWDQHVRGDPDNGVVLKDYRVEPDHP